MKTNVLKLLILIGLLSIQAELLAQHSPATQSCINNIYKCGKKIYLVDKGNVWKGELYSFECGDDKLNR